MYLVLSVFLVGLLLLVAILWAIAPNSRRPTDSERRYENVFSKESLPFPSVFDDTKNQPVLSVVIPAYNEELRITVMLKDAFEYLNDRCRKDPKFSYEIIIVDDGSKDKTSEVAVNFAKDNIDGSDRQDFKVMKLTKNRGKGGAVAQGMLVSQGEYVLFADADGASKFSDVENLENQVKKAAIDGRGLAAGSRAHMVKSDAVVKRSFIRNFLMHIFHFILDVLGIGKIKDTQCGFKLLTKRAVQHIIPNMHVEGWIFDIELLLIAQMLGIPMIEVAVTWHEVDGTKMSLLRDSVIMLLDLLIIRLNYAFGIWVAKIPRTEPGKKDN
ncbi:dolichyl-phosphate beta-glucosyltransferase [Nowakowskiella sp. JEL0078]|nr:dolichyl-phosphate beta-glucosyltransferase [Nowakowskiella sp. JEL0078]